MKVKYVGAAFQFDITCPNCKSILTVDSINDVRYCEMAHHGSPFTTSCPICGKLCVDIPSSKIPRQWYDRLGVE